MTDREQAMLRLLLHLRGHRTPSSSTKDRLLRAAISLFAVKGHEATAMRDVASDVGIKAASIYSHFPGGKEELLAEGLRVVIDDFLAFVIDPLDPSQAAEEQLELLVRRHIRYHLENPTVAVSWDILVDVDRMSRYLTDEVRERTLQQRQLYRDLLGALIREVADDDRYSQERMLAIIAICDRATAWQRTGSLSNDEIVDLGAKMCWSIMTAALATVAE